MTSALTLWLLVRCFESEVQRTPNQLEDGWLSSFRGLIIERAELTSLASRWSTAQGLALRAKIIRLGLKAKSWKPDSAPLVALQVW